MREFLDEVVNNTVLEEGVATVRESIHELVDEQLKETATYDIVRELATDEVEIQGPGIVSYEFLF